MNDTELAEYLGIAHAKERAAIMAMITPAQRAAYEAMRTAEEDIRLWQAGVAPLPPGIIVCRDHARKSKGVE